MEFIKLLPCNPFFSFLHFPHYSDILSHEFLFWDILIIVGNDEQSIPKGDGIRGNNSSDGDKSNNDSEKCHHTKLDWREFRAKLYRDELVIFFHS